MAIVQKYRRSYNLKTISNPELDLSDSASNGCMLLGVQLSKSFQKKIQKVEQQKKLSNESKMKIIHEINKR